MGSPALAGVSPREGELPSRAPGRPAGSSWVSQREENCTNALAREARRRNAEERHREEAVREEASVDSQEDELPLVQVQKKVPAGQ